MHETENLIFGAAKDGDTRALRGSEGAQDFVKRGLSGQGVHVRTRNHDFADLYLAELDGADNEFFFARGEEAALASLLNLNLQLFGGMHRARDLGLCNPKGLYDRTGNTVKQIDGPAKSRQEPGKRPRDQQRHALRARQADGLWHEFADDYVQSAEQGEGDS